MSWWVGLSGEAFAGEHAKHVDRIMRAAHQPLTARDRKTAVQTARQKKKSFAMRKAESMLDRVMTDKRLGIGSKPPSQ